MLTRSLFLAMWFSSQTLFLGRILGQSGYLTKVYRTGLYTEELGKTIYLYESYIPRNLQGMSHDLCRSRGMYSSHRGIFLRVVWRAWVRYCLRCFCNLRYYAADLLGEAATNALCAHSWKAVPWHNRRYSARSSGWLAPLLCDSWFRSAAVVVGHVISNCVLWLAYFRQWLPSVRQQTAKTFSPVTVVLGCLWNRVFKRRSVFVFRTHNLRLGVCSNFVCPRGQIGACVIPVGLSLM